VLDETDGRAARTFNQSSTLGAVLDMVTDRQALFQHVLLVKLCQQWFWERGPRIGGDTEETVAVEILRGSPITRIRRLATAGLLAVLGMLYPRSYMAFLGLMFLDIFSHWSVHMRSTPTLETYRHEPLLHGRAVQQAVSAGAWVYGLGY
jgi:hypothetical protein